MDKSVRFYEQFGFRGVYHWTADDKSLSISHLLLEGLILEIFCYAENSDSIAQDRAAGNNLPDVGVKHFALRVESLAQTRETLLRKGGLRLTESTHGRTGILYFFVQDPDGLWLEIVEDHRVLYAD